MKPIPFLRFARLRMERGDPDIPAHRCGGNVPYMNLTERLADLQVGIENPGGVFFAIIVTMVEYIDGDIQNFLWIIFSTAIFIETLWWLYLEKRHVPL